FSMRILAISIVLLLTTVSPWEEGEWKPKQFRDMEIRVVIKCQIPHSSKFPFDITLIEANRGRSAIFNPDREVAKKVKAKFLDVIYLKGMMEPEIDQVLEPYLLISHKCNMNNQLVEGCHTLPKNDGWTDVFPPPYFNDAGTINVDELEPCPA
ncbi:hypothetical protein PMAYCL1PPCAC_23385, partial [Pristionchus mayeri]